MKVEKSNVISYIALGLSAIALAVSIFSNCPKKPFRHGFGNEMHDRMMQGQRGHEEMRQERPGPNDANRNRPDLHGERRNPQLDGARQPETNK